MTSSFRIAMDVNAMHTFVCVGERLCMCCLSVWGHAVQNACEHAGLHLMRWCVLCDSRALLRRGESLGAGDV